MTGEEKFCFDFLEYLDFVDFFPGSCSDDLLKSHMLACGRDCGGSRKRPKGLLLSGGCISLLGLP